MFVYDELNNTIETERLLLRRFKSDDASKVAVICNTDEVYKGTLTLPHPYTEEIALCWISRHDENFEKNYYYDYAITDKNTRELYGCMGMGVDLNSNMGEIGYQVDPNHWNKGIATEAAKAIIKYGFEVKKFHKINARFFSYNPASGRVMEKAGMKREGLQKKHLWKIDRFEDIILYGIINPNEEEQCAFTGACRTYRKKLLGSATATDIYDKKYDEVRKTVLARKNSLPKRADSEIIESFDFFCQKERDELKEFSDDLKRDMLKADNTSFIG